MKKNQRSVIKTNFTEDQLKQIKDLYDQEFGSRKISKIMNCSRNTIVRAYRQLALDSRNKKVPRKAYKATEKYCKRCNLIKTIDNFKPVVEKGRSFYSKYCIPCLKEYNVFRSRRRKELYPDKIRDYTQKTKNIRSIKNKEYRDKNKEKLKEKANQRRPQIRQNTKKYFTKMRQTSPAFRIRERISSSIKNFLAKNGGSKKGNSCLNKLPYTMEELKKHLENQFEPWMNWDNWGTYRLKEWNDNDSSTWKWQIDHIDPHSDFKYSSMEDEEFKKCWALSNLRPLSAKQNQYDGSTKKRHKK